VPSEAKREKISLTIIIIAGDFCLVRQPRDLDLRYWPSEAIKGNINIIVVSQMYIVMEKIA
jgi:hypothetical protein